MVTGSNPDYSASVRKNKAWEDTVLTPFTKWSGLRALPEGANYLTLCGPMAAPDRQGFAQGSELDRAVKSGLIQPHQFHGVERDLNIHAQNLEAAEKLAVTARPHLHHGEIVDYLNRAQGVHFAIVNLDCKRSAYSEANTLGRCLAALQYLPGPTMLVWNVAVTAPGRPTLLAERKEKLRKDHFLGRMLRDGGWEAIANPYTYKGARGAFKMETVILARSP